MQCVASTTCGVVPRHTSRLNGQSDANLRDRLQRIWRWIQATVSSPSQTRRPEADRPHEVHGASGAYLRCEEVHGEPLSLARCERLGGRSHEREREKAPTQETEPANLPPPVFVTVNVVSLTWLAWSVPRARGVEPAR